jgi:hypothetical protein
LQKKGLPFAIGAELPRLFLRAGFSEPQVSLSQPVFVRGPGKRLAEWTLAEAAPGLVEMGLASRQELDQTLAELKELADDPTTMVACVRMTQVWARK